MSACHPEPTAGRRVAVSFFKLAAIALPRIELTVCASSEQLARQAAREFAETAFANALDHWSDNEPICDDEGEPMGRYRSRCWTRARSSWRRTQSRSPASSPLPANRAGHPRPFIRLAIVRITALR
jgi:hypothetical protein